MQYASSVASPAAAPIPINAFRPLYTRPYDYDLGNCFYFQHSSPRGSTQRCFNCGSISHRVQDCEVPPAEVFRMHERNGRRDSPERRSSNSPCRRRRDYSNDRRVDVSNNHLFVVRPRKCDRNKSYNKTTVAAVRDTVAPTYLSPSTVCINTVRTWSVQPRPHRQWIRSRYRVFPTNWRDPNSCAYWHVLLYSFKYW